MAKPDVTRERMKIDPLDELRKLVEKKTAGTNQTVIVRRKGLDHDR